MKIAAPLGIHVPKTHLMAHLILRTPNLGNPTLYQTFLDESLNKTLKQALRLCHQRRFEHLALLKLNEALRRTAVRGRLQ